MHLFFKMEEPNIIRLTYKEKVPISSMKEILKITLEDKLTNLIYDNDKCDEIVKSLTNDIRIKLKGIGYDRYKFVVQVLLGERREQGIRMGTRCFWDSNTDNQASETFMNVSIFSMLITKIHSAKNIYFTF